MISKEEITEAISRFSTKEILNMYNISQSTLSRLLKKYDLIKKGYGAKLDYSVAKKIRCMYNSNSYTQKELAQLFQVSQPAINKIINNESYKAYSPKITGEAEVKVGYKY